MWEIHGNPRVVDGFPKETWVFHIYMFWLVVSTPLKNMKVSWDDEILNMWKVIKFMFQTTHQYNNPRMGKCTNHTKGYVLWFQSQLGT